MPLTLCRIEPDTEVCIVEMGMRGLGQIAWLASFARPDVGLITNIAPVHLELVGTVENVARAKAELIEALPPGGTAVVPEEPLLEPYLTRTDIEIRRFGQVEEAGRFRVGDREIRLETSYAGPHQLQNTLAALTVCDVLGIPIADGALEVEFSPLREEVIELADGVTLINDCYNANPASMRAALAHLAELAGERRKVAVLGEMAELGDAGAGLPPRGRRRRSRGRRRGDRRGRPARRRVRRGRAAGVEVAQVATPPARRPTRCERSCAPATSCWSRARARWDSKRSRRNYAARWHTSSSRRSSRSSSRSSPARSSSTSCAATRSARRSARRARSTTRSSRARRRWAAC